MSVLIDIKYALRLLLKSPAFTALTITVLAGGLGISIFAFSFLHTVMFKPLPLEEGDRMVRIIGRYQGERGALDAYEAGTVLDQLSKVKEVGRYFENQVLLTQNDSRRSFYATYSDWNIFEFSNVKPLMGRGFVPNDNADGVESVAVIGYDVWQNYFSGSKDVIDKVVRLNGSPIRVVGVMPKGYAFPVAAQLWIAASNKMLHPAGRNERTVNIYAKMSENATVDELNLELQNIMGQIRQRFPDLQDGNLVAESAFAIDFPMAQLGDNAYLTFSTLNLVSIFILLLACINVGNLLLSRANERAKETAIRVALGAPRYRLVLQMMWESIIICLVGGLLAIFLAGWALGAVNIWANSNLSGNLAFWWDWGINTPTIIAAIVFILLTIFVAGVIPAWKAAHGDFNSALRDGTRGALGRQAGKITRILVVVEIALISIVMFLGSMASTIAYKASHIDVGFDTNNVITAPIELTDPKYDTAVRRYAFYNQLQSKLSQSTEFVFTMLEASFETSQFVVSGVEYHLESDFPTAYVKAIEGEQATVGIKLIEGRNLNQRDRADSLNVSVISKALADKYWPNQSAINQRVKLKSESESSEWLTIVGVVSNVINGNPLSSSSSELAIYRPLSQVDTQLIQIIAKHIGNENEARSLIYQTINSIDVMVFPTEVIDISEMLAKIGRVAAAMTDLFVSCGIFALMLAVTGIYGLTANSIIQRTQEIGIRRAIGATDITIVKLFMLQGSRQLIIGLSIGITIASLVSFVLSHLFALDTSTYYINLVVVPLIIASIVLIAVYIPTRRAVKLEPSDALRHE